MSDRNTPGDDEAVRPTLKQDLVQDAVGIALTWKENITQHGGNLHLLMSRIYDRWEPELSAYARSRPVTELLPCPFCGGEAERLDIEDGENAGGSCISCKRCLASSNIEFEFKENFVSNWNRRAISQPSPAAGADYVVVLRDMEHVLRRIQDTLSRHVDPGGNLQDPMETVNAVLDIADHKDTLAKQRRAIALLAAAPAQPAPTVRSAHHFSDKECPDCGATNIHVLGFSCQHEHCPLFAEEQKPCPVCGNEERGQGGYLSCECPAPIAAGEEE